MKCLGNVDRSNDSMVARYSRYCASNFTGADFYCPDNPTATLLEYALLTQGFMGGSKAGFLHVLQPQNRDSTRANVANTQK